MRNPDGDSGPRMIRSRTRLVCATLAAAAILGKAATVGAQEADTTRLKFMLSVPDLRSIIAPSNFFRGAPGASSGSPLAFGPDWGDAFVGAGYQNSTRGIKQPSGTITPNSRSDGTVSAGFGLGDGRRAVSVQVVATSLSTVRAGLFQLTAYSFQLSRMLGNTSAVAIGVEDAFTIGGDPGSGPGGDGTDSWYAVASKVFLLRPASSDVFKALTVSGGIGNGRFRSLSDVTANRQGVNAFGSASLLVTGQLSVIADYAGQDLNLGLSLIPFANFPVVFTPAMADVTRTASRTPRFELGVGIGMHFD
jgi:hypothetical protein